MKGRGQKVNDDYFNTANGSVSAEYALPLPGNLNSQIDQIREAYPNLSKEDAAVVLQSCDCNLETAIVSITQDGAENILSSWNFQGKRGKNGPSPAKSRRRRNKKNRNRRNEDDNVEGKEESLNELIKPAEELFLASEKEESIQISQSQSSINVLESLPSSRKSSVSMQSESPLTPLTPKSADAPSFNEALGANKTTEPPKKRNVIDAMPRSARDLQRSTVAIARFHAVHEDKCDKAEKEIKSHFKKIRDSLLKREELLLEQLQTIKVEAAKLLDDRQQQAAILKHQCDQIGRLRDQDITELRANIKHFVGDRKIDEEVANTNRFVGDSDEIIKVIESFGHVTPLKAGYKQRSSSTDNMIKPIDDPPQRKLQADLKGKGVLQAADVELEQKKNQGDVNRPLTNDELKERAATHTRLKEAVEEQTSMAAGRSHVMKQNETKVPAGQRVNHQHDQKLSRAQNNADKVVQRPGRSQVKQQQQYEEKDRKSSASETTKSPGHSQVKQQQQYEEKGRKSSASEATKSPGHSQVKQQQQYEEKGRKSSASETRKLHDNRSAKNRKYRDRQSDNWRKNTDWRQHDDRSYAGSDRKSDSTAITKEEDKVGELSAEKGRTEAPAVTEKKDRVTTSNENAKKPENTASSESKEKEEKTQQQTGHKERDFVNHRGHSSNKERGQSGTGKRRHVENKIEQPVVEHHIEKPVIKEEHSLENLHGSGEKARREHQTAQRPSMKMKREQQNHRWENEMDRDQKIVRDRGGPQRQNWTDRRNREHELDNHKTNNKVEEKPDKGTVSAEKDDVIQRDEWYNAGIEKQATEVSTRVDRGSNARSFDQGERRRGHYNRYRNNHQKNKASYTNGNERTDSEAGKNRSHGDAINKGKGPPSDESKVYQKEAGVGLSGEEKSQTNIGNLNGETKSNTANSSSLVPAVTPTQGTKTAGAKTTEENSQGEKRQDKKDPSVDTQAQKPYTHDRLPQRTRNNRGQYYRKKNYKGSDNRGDVITKNDEKDYRNEKTFDKKRTAHGVENGYSEGNSTSTRSVRSPGKTESKNEVNDKRSDANMKGKSAVSNHNSDVSGKKHDSVTSNGIKEEHGVKPAYSKKQNSTANSNKPREISYHNGTHNDDTRKVKDVNENYST